MTGASLATHLRNSGTPARVAALADVYVVANPSADSTALRTYLATQAGKQSPALGSVDHVTPGTLTKADVIIAAGGWVQPVNSPVDEDTTIGE